MDLLENFRVAWRSVKANLLRALLTTMIIAVGIMALVGILTAIDAAIYSLSSNLSSLGANTIEIDRISTSLRGNNGRGPRKRSAPFTYDQATEFADRYEFPAEVSISFFATGATAVKYRDTETNPNIAVYGISVNYLTAKGFVVDQGRNLTYKEVAEGANIAVIGSAMVDDLFDGKHAEAIGKEISFGPLKLRVVGTLEARGSAMNGNQDRRVLIPLQTAKRFYGSNNTSYDILIAISDPTQVDAAIAEATVTMRKVRRLKAGEENDFEVENSGDLVSMIKENTTTLRAAAVAIGLMTLLGAAIGLMNIMLVTVTERTKEIGVRKALGATRRNVLYQFLIEAIVICQLGGILGIIGGVLLGNVVAAVTGGGFIVPWLWILLAFVVCTAVGLLSGLYPALRAAALDPIESLRYE